MEADLPGAEWVDELQELVVHGRDDGEATALAIRHLRDDPVGDSTSTEGDTAMGPLEQLDELEPLLGQIASGIRPDDLEAPTPCETFTVRGVLDHMTGGATQFAAAFRGEPEADLASDPGDGADPVARAGNALASLMGSIRAPGALERTVVTPFGPMPGEAFARFVVLDGLVHGWDIAVATDQAYQPSDELVAAVDAFARQTIAPAMRDGDTFAPAVEPPQDATPIERLAAFTGRGVSISS